MKKIIFSVMAAAALFTACDPAEDRQSWSGEIVTAEQLTNGIVVEQFGGGKDGSDNTPSQTGNWIKWSTNPSKVVRVYYVKKDGSQADLSVGTANGMFYLKPSRGSDPNVTLYFETHEFDGSSVTGQKQVTVEVAQELTKEMAMICSNSGSKTWKWNVDGKQVWGNLGYTPSDGDTFAETLGGVWWGVNFDSDTFENQQQHRGSDAVTGDDDPNATMVFEEDGTVKCYDKDGKEIRKGSFEIKNFDETSRKVVNDQPWHLGTLHTSKGAILWPYAINMDGFQPEDFEIVRLNSSELVLTYAAAGTGAWSEATFWRFRSDTDAAGSLGGYDANGVDWTWDTEIGTFWGNVGYQAGGDWSNANQGQWWGVTCTEDFAGQQQHRGGEEVTGDDDTNAYMTFFNDGSLKSFDATGKVIRQGSWEINMTPTSEFNLGTFKTTKGSILWPYAINMDGFQPEEFEVVYVSNKKLALVYAAPGTGAWSEATFWRFMKK